MDEQRLKDKLAKIEALLAGATTPGERTAAANARERIVERLERMASEEQPEEHRFSIEDPYSRSLFVALVRRYGLRPYRRRGQHRRTIMVKAPPRFVKDILFPEFKELAEELHAELAEITGQVISRAVHRDTSESDEEPAGQLGD